MEWDVLLILLALRNKGSVFLERVGLKPSKLARTGTTRTKLVFSADDWSLGITK